MSLLDERSWTEKIFVSDWTKGGAGAQDVVEPATGEVLGRIGVASTDDVERARSRAPASESGRTCGPRNAPPCCGAPATCGSSTARRSASGWCARQDRSRPKPDWSVRRRRRSVTKQPRYRQHPAGHVLPSAEPRWSLARRRPVGVVTVIAPFNFPLILSIRSVAPALDPIGGAEGTRALGKAVPLKPDPRTAVCWGVALLRVFQEVGLPAGLLQLLPG